MDRNSCSETMRRTGCPANRHLLEALLFTTLNSNEPRVNILDLLSEAGFSDSLGQERREGQSFCVLCFLIKSLKSNSSFRVAEFWSLYLPRLTYLIPEIASQINCLHFCSLCCPRKPGEGNILRTSARGILATAYRQMAQQ